VPNLLPEEQKMMEVKYASPCFGAVPEESLILIAEPLLLKLHVITGWAIPKDELMTILTDQFVKKMVESYPMVNSEEMEYAFRNNTGVKDWGKAMNLNLIDEVLAPYLEKRKELSRMEEEKKMKQLQLPAPEVSDDEFIEAVKTSYMATKKWKVIPVLAYNILYKQEKIKLTVDQKNKVKSIVDEAWPDLPEEAKADYYKAYSVMLHFENISL
jgi:hypothetical protein